MTFWYPSHKRRLLCSFEGPRGSRRSPVAMARGRHLFPFRTEQLSPSAPMVLGPQGPGRVGRRRFFHRWAARRAAHRAFWGRSRARSARNDGRWRSCEARAAWCSIGVVHGSDCAAGTPGRRRRAGGRRSAARSGCRGRWGSWAASRGTCSSRSARRSGCRGCRGSWAASRADCSSSAKAFSHARAARRLAVQRGERRANMCSRS
jgi:hypothetical protein